MDASKLLEISAKALAALRVLHVQVCVRVWEGVWEGYENV